MRILISLFFLLLIGVFPALGQTDNPVLIKEFAMEELTYGKFPANTLRSEITPFDLVGAQKLYTNVKISEMVFGDGHHITETRFTNSNEIFEQWPVAITRIVSDSSGIKMFDTYDELWHFSPADSTYLSNYNETRTENIAANGFIPNTFPLPGAELLAYLDSLGAVVKLLDEQAILISHPDEEVLYEPGKLLVTSNIFSEGRLIRTHQMRYKNLPGHGVVLSNEREVLYETKESGLCIEQVTVRKYADYNFQIGERTQSGQPMRSAEPFVWPVPAADVLFVQMPTNAMPSGTIRLINALGSLMIQIPGIQPEVTYPVEVKHLPKGVYYLQTDLLSGPHTHKVLKN